MLNMFGCRVTLISEKRRKGRRLLTQTNRPSVNFSVFFSVMNHYLLRRMKGTAASFSCLCTLKRCVYVLLLKGKFTKAHHFEVPFEVFPEETVANYLVFHDEFCSVH